jgi:hypothetical protein
MDLVGKQLEFGWYADQVPLVRVEGRSAAVRCVSLRSVHPWPMTPCRRVPCDRHGAAQNDSVHVSTRWSSSCPDRSARRSAVFEHLRRLVALHIWANNAQPCSSLLLLARRGAHGTPERREPPVARRGVGYSLPFPTPHYRAEAAARAVWQTVSTADMEDVCHT